MDVHKKFTYAVVKEKDGNMLSREKFDNSKENFQVFLKPFLPTETQIVIESTGVWEYIYNIDIPVNCITKKRECLDRDSLIKGNIIIGNLCILDELGYGVKLANPFRTRAIAEARKKTDVTDAETLADLLRANLIVESYIPPKEIRRLRELTRERGVTVKQTTQIKNRIHAILTKRGIKLPTVTLCKKSLALLLKKSEEEPMIKHYLNLLEKYEEELKSIEDKIVEVACTNSKAQLLMTIPGIAEMRAVQLIAEIGEIERFKTSERFCSYAGLVPSIRQSGSTLKFGRLVKQANKIIKKTLVEASWNIVSTKEPNKLQAFYKKLMKKKGKQKAICAVAHKLGSIIHAMLRKNQEFMLL